MKKSDAFTGEKIVNAARVLIVDDDRLMQRLLSEIFNSSDKLEVVGTASDPYEARQLIKRLDPDVVTLDVVMPKMDGLTFLDKIMRLKPTPVVMVSSLVEDRASVALEAMEMGAIDVIAKPKLDRMHDLAYVEEIIEKIVNAASARSKVQSIQLAHKSRSIQNASNARVDLSYKQQLGSQSGVQSKGLQPIIAIGASTGGTVAITDVLKHLPSTTPAIVIAQHIPEAFSGQFAVRANKITAMEVCEAQHGQPILPGHVYVAPGDKHLLIERDGNGYRCKLDDGPPVNRHRPSVDVLFRTVAEIVGSKAVGVLLTGMGKDGAIGLKEMKDAGASTIAQDEESSVVWGMPGSAVAIGAAIMVEPLNQIYARLMELG